MLRLFLSALLSIVVVSCQQTSLRPILSNNVPQTSPAITVGNAPHGLVKAGNFLYVLNQGEHSLSVLDLKQEIISQTLILPAQEASSLASSKDETVLVIGTQNPSQLHLYSPQEKLSLIQRLDLEGKPDTIKIEDRHVWVSFLDRSFIMEFDFQQGWDTPPQIRSWKAGRGDGKSHRPLAFAGNWLAVTNPADNNVSLIHRLSGEERKIRDGNHPVALSFAYERDRVSHLLIANNASHSISVFNLLSQETQTVHNLGQNPSEIISLPSIGRSYVSMAGSNHIAVIDSQSGTLIGTVSTGKRPLHLYLAPNETFQTQHDSSQGNDPEIWVSHDQDPHLSVFNGRTLELLNQYPVGQGHHKVAFGLQKAYVTNLIDNTLSLLERHQHEKDH